MRGGIRHASGEEGVRRRKYWRDDDRMEKGRKEGKKGKSEDLKKLRMCVCVCGLDK
jgi:hypothetical protein